MYTSITSTGIFCSEIYCYSTITCITLINVLLMTNLQLIFHMKLIFLCHCHHYSYDQERDIKGSDNIDGLVLSTEIFQCNSQSSRGLLRWKIYLVVKQRYRNACNCWYQNFWLYQLTFELPIYEQSSWIISIKQFKDFHTWNFDKGSYTSYPPKTSSNSFIPEVLFD